MNNPCDNQYYNRYCIHKRKLIFFINLDFYAHPIKERIIYVHIKKFRFSYINDTTLSKEVFLSLLKKIMLGLKLLKIALSRLETLQILPESILNDRD